MKDGRSLSSGQRRQVALITLAAVAVFVVFRVLPTGTNLSHMDFRASGKNSIEFCDPANPQFIPVVNMRSPVTLALVTSTPSVAGSEAAATVTLRTASGKAVAPEDLLVMHTKKLHLLLVDPTLTDYQHVHPVPAPRVGEWQFHFTPQRRGLYRVFADFTPVATNRGLYASAELEVLPGQGATMESPATLAVIRAAKPLPQSIEREGYRFTLETTAQPIRAGQTVDLVFSIVRPAGGEVPLEPVMGAFAHLVAFDEARSGFAHLHPMESDLLKRLDPLHPMLQFKIMIPQAGRYVIWSQVNLAGREVFVPFWFEVL